MRNVNDIQVIYTLSGILVQNVSEYTIYETVRQNLIAGETIKLNPINWTLISFNSFTSIKIKNSFYKSPKSLLDTYIGTQDFTLTQQDLDMFKTLIPVTSSSWKETETLKKDRDILTDINMAASEYIKKLFPSTWTFYDLVFNYYNINNSNWGIFVSQI